MKMLQRILAEKRRFIVPLALALLANAAVYSFVVYPLRARVGSGEQRVAVAERTLAAAVRDHMTARATVTGKTRAEEELATFYGALLPADLKSAQRITTVHVAQLAEQNNVQFRRRTVEEERERDRRTLNRFRVTVMLEGSYEDIRRFIHALETGPEFVVLENVSLAVRGESESSLALTLGLLTYYRAVTNGP